MPHRRISQIASFRPWGLTPGVTGVVLSIVAPGTWWAGQVLGWDEMRVAGLTAALVLVVAAFSWIGRSPFEVLLVLGRNRVVVGQRVIGSIEVINTSDRATLPAELTLPVGSVTARFALPRLTAGATHEEAFVVPTRQRAVVMIGPVRSVRADPLGVARREVRWNDSVELFVHPRTTRLDGTSAGFIRDLDGRAARDISPSDIAFHAVREYSPGDDRRHVHWRSTARTGRLMVRQFEETRRSHLVIGLPTSTEGWGEDPAAFELGVEVAASLGLHALAEDRDLTVVADRDQITSTSARRLLDDLTRVQTSPSDCDLTGLVAQLGIRAPTASMAVLVVGNWFGIGDLHTAVQRLPLGVGTLVVRCVPGAESSGQMLERLTVVTVGQLDDLATALRRVADR